MATRKWKEDLKAVAWVLALAFVFTIYACTGSLADNLIKDYDISWGTGDGPVGAEDPAVASGGWANLSPATDDIQATLDWIDDNWPAGGSCYLQRNVTVLTTATAGDTFELDQTSEIGNALMVERDLDSDHTNAAVVYILQDNAGDDRVALQIFNTGSGGGVHATAGSAVAVYGTSNTGAGVAGNSTNSYGVSGNGGAGNDDYGIFSVDKSKAGTSDTFDEWNTASSPYGVAPPGSDAREYYLDTDYWFALNSGGKVYGWSDRDGDTGIDVEKTADLDKLNFKTGGTERAVLDSTALDLAVPCDANGFKSNGTAGISTTVDCVYDVDPAGMQLAYNTLTFTDGLLTAVTDQGWVPAPISGP